MMILVSALQIIDRQEAACNTITTESSCQSVCCDLKVSLCVSRRTALMTLQPDRSASKISSRIDIKEEVAAGTFALQWKCNGDRDENLLDALKTAEALPKTTRQSLDTGHAPQSKRTMCIIASTRQAKIGRRSFQLGI